MEHKSEKVKDLNASGTHKRSPGTDSGPEETRWNEMRRQGYFHTRVSSLFG